ncbi:MAG: hypothetical protein KBC84_09275 [Proteobacteria bacterium]|nr:hypothetical protein [Pseudomonadota bacterium]
MNMKKEYNFSKGVRGKYYKRFLDGTNLVRLDSDVKEAFPTSKDVNKALKTILQAFDPKQANVPNTKILFSY